MNLIRRLHSQAPVEKDLNRDEFQTRDAPFWVRHYDIVTNLMTLGRTKTVHRQTLSLANLQSGDAVLDIGCGTGYLAIEAEKIVGKEGRVVGLDVEAEMIRQARRRADKSQSQVTFDNASIDQIPYPDDTFDVVFSTLMYHHLSESQRTDGIAEVARVLAPNGRLLLVDINPSRRSILTSLPGHNQAERQDFVRREVTEQMEAAGLTLVETGPHPSKQLSYAIGQKRG